MTVEQKRHMRLNSAFRNAGYKVLRDGSKYRVHSLPVAWLPGETSPRVFTSMQAVADYLIPIVRDDQFTEKVRA